MHREILFRGKRVDNGEWADGCLVFDKMFYGKPCEHSYIVNHEHPSGCFCGDICIEVIPETVGQYTGMTDKNGKRIFEGDIIKYKDGGFVANCIAKFGPYEGAGRNEKHHLGFYLDWSEKNDLLRKDICFWSSERLIEVIGNIHDNPEFLEEGDKK